MMRQRQWRPYHIHHDHCGTVTAPVGITTTTTGEPPPPPNTPEVVSKRIGAEPRLIENASVKHHHYCI